MIRQYVNALNKKDLPGASAARTFSANEAKSWQNIVKTFDTYQLAAKMVADPVIAGDSATVKVEERIQRKQKKGDITITLQPRQVDYKLEKNRVGGTSYCRAKSFISYKKALDLLN